jgi:hypothetical protein
VHNLDKGCPILAFFARVGHDAAEGPGFYALAVNG